MKKIMLAVTLLAAAPVARAEGPRGGMFGAGVVLGDPMGGTGKYWVDSNLAVDFGVGYSEEAALYADVVWHAWDLFPQPKDGKLGAYLSAGPRIETQNRTEFAIRTMLGVSYWPPGSQPIEIFAEAGPVFRTTPSGELDADGGVGIRFYFGGSPGKSSGK